MARYVIRTKLRELAEAHQPPLSIAQIAELTRLSDNTVRRWYNNDFLARYEREVIIEISKLFALTSIQDLLEMSVLSDSES